MVDLYELLKIPKHYHTFVSRCSSIFALASSKARFCYHQSFFSCPFLLIYLASMNTQLTYGQAYCLVFGFPPTKENHEKTKQYFDTSLLDVCYIDSLGPRRPIATVRGLISRDPFTYHSYSYAPPLSPSKYFVKESKS
ncbi:uncharacterized protein BX663DRAFT_495312 [Cokeromyces recurvatus]|uniref:uncharacterized protein n=1 Tax=Cokeromyces recurvatus TaxID=90255 RepID=UPI00221EA9DB|nr:uncharacterized protein BX663DRAFT_495312 [Cokeromyces recurvatus]KAI7907250.1 hypothetical protein BX663DRAFT_495312 [Cokeromyces recurvatus]